MDRLQRPSLPIASHEARKANSNQVALQRILSQRTDQKRFKAKLLLAAETNLRDDFEASRSGTIKYLSRSSPSKDCKF
jgi:hypothetical protein